MRRSHQLPTFEDYLFEACERITRSGGDPKLLSTKDVGDRRVLLNADLAFAAQDVELSLFEVVEKTAAGSASRQRYRYRCWLTGRPVFRYERDPVGHPEMPDHKHLHDGTRIATDEIALGDVLDNFWDEIHRETRRRQRQLQRASSAA